MDAIASLFFIFVILCIFCALWVGAVLFVVGTIILVAKLIVWMAYLGFCFIILALIGLGLAKLFGR